MSGSGWSSAERFRARSSAATRLMGLRARLPVTEPASRISGEDATRATCSPIRWNSPVWPGRLTATGLKWRMCCAADTVSHHSGTDRALCHAVKFRNTPGMSPQECSEACGGDHALLGSSTAQGRPPASLGPGAARRGHPVRTPSPLVWHCGDWGPGQAPLTVVGQQLRNQTLRRKEATYAMAGKSQSPVDAGHSFPGEGEFKAATPPV